MHAVDRVFKVVSEFTEKLSLPIHIVCHFISFFIFFS